MNDISDAYRDAPPLTRIIVKYRPAICPPERITSRIPGNSTVLDVGCGNGALLLGLALSNRLHSGTGCDVSPRAIKVAENAALVAGVTNLSFSRIQGLDDLPEGPFDVVTVIDVMHHVPSRLQREFFSACARRVRSSGLLIYKDMANRPLFNNVFNRLHDAILANDWINYVPLGMVQEWASEEGFDCEDQDRFRRFAYSHELLTLRNRKSK
jgi:2-polyprenyl-3-methyl-5-hydroxy-6-metoxy-1,4-benzoquinol methylase